MGRGYEEGKRGRGREGENSQQSSNSKKKQEVGRRTCDEPPSNARPRLVLRQRVVKLARKLPQRRQPSPGDGGEIVVLVVVADVVGEDVERAVVGPGFLVVAVEEVVFSNLRRGEEGQKWREGGKGRGEGRTNEVTSARVQASCHVTAQEEVKHRVPTEVLHDEGVEGELGDEVPDDPLCRSLVADKAGTEGVEEDLEGAAKRESSEYGERRGGGVRANQKKVFPRTVRRTRSSRRVGMSVSMPSSPRNCRRVGREEEEGKKRINSIREEREKEVEDEPCGAQCGTS
jgi:hypothetical protein